MRVLYVAYPLLPVTEASAGGAEQMLWVLEREINRRGHSTVVAACQGSRVSGKLLETGSAAPGVDRFAEREAEHSGRILDYIADCEANGQPFDLIHDKSGHFWKHAGEQNLPVLATLHLARRLYTSEMFKQFPPNLFFNCVSQSHRESFRDLPHVMGVIENGIVVDDFPFTREKGDYVLWLGRICEEKGTHLAIESARKARVQIVVAGAIYPFSYHQQYFAREVEPLLSDGAVRFVNEPTFERKLELLRHARAVLLPSVVEESSSLVAMEAMACGTPVVGFRRGAVPEVVEHGVTGYVVDNVEQMAAAIGKLGSVSPEACRERVEQRFCSQRMADDYERLYAHVIQKPSSSFELGRL